MSAPVAVSHAAQDDARRAVGDPSASAAGPAADADRLRAGCVLAIVVCASLFVVMQYGRLGHPLLWQDEGETAMFGRRVLDTGLPRVHGPEGVVYGMSVPMTFAVDADTGAYTGSLWGQYYFAAAAVALSDVADEPVARTALVRLPFALAGSAGLALLYLAVAPAFGGRRERAVMGCAYLLALAGSVSLLLHVREARYYALVVAGVGALLWVRARTSGAVRGVGQALALFALFNVFYPAAVACAAWIVVESVLPLRHAEARGPRALRSLAIEWAPLVAVAVAVLPVVVWFRMLPLAELVSARYRFGLADYGVNVLVVARHLAAHEWLLAALVLRAAAWAAGGRVEGRAQAPALWRLVLIWIAVGARNPIFFERYFVALGPLLVLAALLDFDRLRRAMAAAQPGDGRGRAAIAAIAVVCVGGTLVLKAPELAGRVRELAVPVQGPLDVAIPWVAARWPGGPGTPPPVVATNYETEPWMFYLGARAVGRFHADTPEAAREEALVQPDFVVPRRGYPQSVARLRGYLARGEYERHVLDVADLPYNTIPELSAGRVVAVTHPFETVRPRHPGEALEVWVRAPAAAAP